MKAAFIPIDALFGNDLLPAKIHNLNNARYNFAAVVF